MPHYPDEIVYCEKYTDSFYDYRYVIISIDITGKSLGNYLYENEWIDFGIQQLEAGCILTSKAIASFIAVPLAFWYRSANCQSSP